MGILIGLVVTLGCVLGGFMAMGGHLHVLLQPWEAVVICGAALGTFLVANPMKTVKALVGETVVKSARCCGESGTLGVTRPDISTQVRFRKEEELRKDETALRAIQAAGAGVSGRW